MNFTCGCSDNAENRCLVHETWCCHGGCAHTGAHFIPECPPCKLARLRSVNLDSSATPTRGTR